MRVFFWAARGLFFGSTVLLPLQAADQDVAVNEIHYHPASDDPRDEFIELHDRGSEWVDLSGWSFSRGVLFARGTIVPPPFPEPGTDPTPDGLPCEWRPGCGYSPPSGGIAGVRSAH